MHQIARLLELPGNVGPSCPSPPSLNLHSLRKEAAAHSEFRICLRRSRSPIYSADNKSSRHFNGTRKSPVRVPAPFVSPLRFESSDPKILKQSSHKPEIDKIMDGKSVASVRRVSHLAQTATACRMTMGGDNLDVLGIHRHCYI